MSRFKKCQVVMLPTKEKAPIIKIGNWKKLVIVENKTIIPEDEDESYQNLYITSDDDIKEGDWCINISKNIIYQKDKLPMDMMWNKIIATTDSSLKLKKHQNGCMYDRCLIHTCDNKCSLSQPSQSFIEKFVESYNKNIVIDNVLVEYECPQCKDWGYVSDCKENCNKKFLELKVNPKDNTITIKRVKDSWSREEVIKVIKNYQEECGDQCPGSIEEMKKWIDKNL